MKTSSQVDTRGNRHECDDRISHQLPLRFARRNGTHTVREITPDDPRTRLCRELLEKLWMPWPELMLLRILHQVYHIQIKAVAVIATSTMYTLESSLAALDSRRNTPD